MFDPFGDADTRGYLRNVIGTSDPKVIQKLESRAFAANVPAALAALKAAQAIGYDQLLDTHRRLFGSVYPWAGQDRSELAPAIAIAKAGIPDLFAHPADVRRAASYAFDMARDPASMRRRPGEIFGALAFAHPFLEANGRSIMTVHADLTRRAGFHIAWQQIGKQEFLAALTAELRQPGKVLDALFASHIRPGALPISRAAADLTRNPGLTGRGSSPSP